MPSRRENEAAGSGFHVLSGIISASSKLLNQVNDYGIARRSERQELTASRSGDNRRAVFTGVTRVARYTSFEEMFDHE
jgi:hypothetical protein